MCLHLHHSLHRLHLNKSILVFITHYQLSSIFFFFLHNIYHVFLVTVRPQGASSPYKKNNYSAVSNSPSSGSMATGSKTWKSPLTGINVREPVAEESLSKIQVIIFNLKLLFFFLIMTR